MFKPVELKNEYASGGKTFDRNVEPQEVHLLICALDYKGTSNPLTCTLDGNNMQALARSCGIEDIEVMYDTQCQKKNVAEKIKQMAQRCNDNDFFVFYYSGHGTSVPDKDGDEDDGKDEALCFVGPSGQLAAQYFMTDDEIATLFTETFGEGVRILILTDCCHSGTIGDLDKPAWKNHQAITMSGCADDQTSGDIGKGGIFTHSLLLAIDHLTTTGEEEFAVGQVYNATLHEDETMFHSTQDIQLRCSRAVKPQGMPWPLVPKGDYKAPLSQAVSTAYQAVGASPDQGGSVNPNDLVAALLNNPGLLNQLGLSPQMAAMIGELHQQVAQGPGEDYLQQIQAVGGMCGLCSIQ